MVFSILTFIVTFVATAILSELMRPKPKFENARPADLGEFQVTTATEGRPVPLIWGTVKLSGPNIVWYGDLRQVSVVETVKVRSLFRKKKKRFVVGFKYYLGIQFGFCRGPVDNIRKIWVGEKEVWSGVQAAGSIAVSAPTLFGGDKLGQGGVSGTFNFLLGNETQVANTYLSAFQAQGGDTPAYRGTCYGVFEQGYIGNTTTPKQWEVELRRIPTQLSAVNESVNSGNDANPAHVLYEILTDDEWGLGIAAGSIDSTNFQAAADTLFAEGNGFSMVLDRQTSAPDLIQELERQIDGTVYQDPLDGKWKIKLVRADFEADKLYSLDQKSVVRVESFTRSTWEDTINQVRVPFQDRAREYFRTSALAQDMANFELRGKTEPVEARFPGVKDAALANQLAWRELRAQAYPLAQLTVVADRTARALIPGDAVRWSDETLGVDIIVFRVARIDRGLLEKGQVRLTLVQDVFSFDPGAFADSPASGWTPPADTLVAIPAIQSIIIEAPKAMVDRDPENPGVPDRLFISARQQNDGAVLYEARARVSPDSFAAVAEDIEFMFIGELVSALDRDTAQPTTSIVVDATPDTQAAIRDAFGVASKADIGQNLSQLIMIGDEFLGVESAEDTGGDVQLNNVWRGMLDSVPGKHAAGAEVYLVFVDNALSESGYEPSDTVDVRLISQSSTDELAEGSATNVQVTMGNRTLRPYPPTEMEVNSTLYPTGNQDLDRSFDGGGGGLDAKGLQTEYIRRSFLTTDEVDSIETDRLGTPPDANTTVYRVRVTDDPDGTPVELFVTAYNSGSARVDVTRQKILRELDGVIPSRLELEVETKHTVDSTDYTATQALTWDFPTIDSAYAGDTNLGSRAADAITNVYTAPENGTYNVDIGTALTAGKVQYRLNGGGWLDVITAGTNGTIAGVVATDTIELKTTNSPTSTVPETMVTITAPTSASNAYGVFEIS